MVGGVYFLALKTPMGIKNGELVLEELGNVLTGRMKLFGTERGIIPGRREGSRFAFSGEWETAVGVLAYECTGLAEGDTLSGVAKTRKGDFPMKAVRKPAKNKK